MTRDRRSGSAPLQREPSRDDTDRQRLEGRDDFDGAILAPDRCAVLPDVRRRPAYTYLTRRRGHRPSLGEQFHEPPSSQRLRPTPRPLRNTTRRHARTPFGWSSSRPSLETTPSLRPHFNRRRHGRTACTMTLPEQLLGEAILLGRSAVLGGPLTVERPSLQSVGGDRLVREDER